MPGVFTRLPQEAFVALAAFAIAFASAVVVVEPRVRGWLAARGGGAAWTAAMGLAALLVAAGAALGDGAAVNPAAAPWAPVFLFGLPVTVAAAVSAIRAARASGGTRKVRAVQMAGD